MAGRFQRGEIVRTLTLWVVAHPGAQAKACLRQRPCYTIQV